MRRWKTPPYCLARAARPRWVSWSIINMFPMIGNPFGPGGYGALRRVRCSKTKRSVVSGTMNKIAMLNGFRLDMASEDFRNQSMWLCGF